MSKQVGDIINCKLCAEEKRTGVICPVHMPPEIREVGRTIKVLDRLRHDIEDVHDRYSRIKIKININLYNYMKREYATFSNYLSLSDTDTLMGFPLEFHNHDDYRILAEIEL